jgi:hypothetical protein
MPPESTNPFDDYYEQVKKKTVLHLQKKVFNEQMLARMKETFAEKLEQEQIVFTRNEKRRMYEDVLQDIFDEILADISLD